MIPYVEILNKDLKKFALIEPQECWFELSFYENGEFEIYCKANTNTLNALKKGNFVMIPNKRFIWYITAIQYTYNAGGARMISAKGKEAKWLLNKRCILTPKELTGTITSAIYNLVNQNLGSLAAGIRQIKGLYTATEDILIDISGTQATRGKLGDFVNTLLKTYNCGSQITFEGGLLVYKIFTGDVKSGTVKFSQSYDNLLSSEYLTDDEDLATNVMVVSTIDDVDYTQIYDTGPTGIDRSEIIVNSNLSTKYEDANGVEQETPPTSPLYIGWQIEEGKNALANYKTVEELNGELDLVNSNYEFEKDFFLGDIVKVQDEYFKFSYNTRILKYTFRQDASGYAETAEYGGQ